MRLVGTLTEEGQARRFADYLLTLQMPAEVRPAAGGWSVWIVREDQLASGQGEFASFLAGPDAPHYVEAARAASALRKEAIRTDREHQRNTTELRPRVDRVVPRQCPILFLLIAGSVLVAAVTSLGQDHERLAPFYFSPPTLVLVERDLGHGVPQSRDRVERERGNGAKELRAVLTSAGLEPIKQGQLWRLFTPMFIHYGWPHLIFNMVALYWFGGLIELRKGSWVLLGLVLASAPISFFCQYLWDVRHSGPEQISLPGGMSGVIYALFGYMWMLGEYEPESGLRLTSNTIVWMLLMLVLCFTGALGPIANAAHFSGLVFGMLVGLAPHLIGSRHARGTDSGP